MKQKVLKPVFLLMISIIMCRIPMLGYFPLAQSWYGAMCGVNYMSIWALPIMMWSMLSFGGILAAMKYSAMMMATGICMAQYKKMTENYNSLVTSIIVTLIATAMETMDWAMRGLEIKELFGLVPIVMLVWSATVIFSYIIKKIMAYVPGKNSQLANITRQQIIQNDGITRTSEAFKNLAKKIQKISQIEECGEVSIDGAIEQEINGSICRGCENGQIQYLERARLNYLWYNKMVETREAMAIQLNEMADIMEQYTRPVYEEKKVILGMEDYLRRRLRERRIVARKIGIFENGKGRIEVRIVAKKKRKSAIAIDIVENVVSEAVGTKMRFYTKEIVELTTEFSEYLFLEEVNFMTISGVARRTKESFQCSGDNFTTMEMNGGQTFLSICDGMGSGQRARNYSETVIDLLEQLLESGFGEETALKLINSVLLSGNQWQEPATVDMALIDQYSGICQFLKMGAACTYIKRGNWVECIKSTSLPMGVLENVDVETITKKLYDGDFVIMISDGMVEALSGEDKEGIMGRMIMEIKTASPREMAVEIMGRILAITDGLPKDDMTVICTGIWDKI